MRFSALRLRVPADKKINTQQTVITGLSLASSSVMKNFFFFRQECYICMHQEYSSYIVIEENHSSH